MDPNILDSVTDPSDFPEAILQKLDNSLRCSICKDFYDGPVLLHCGHTFCSICIRLVLPSKPECPTCRTPAKEIHLIRNTMFGEAVKSWSDARPLVIKKCKEPIPPPPAVPFTPAKNKKRKLSSGLVSSNPQDAGPSRLDRSNLTPAILHNEQMDVNAPRQKKTRRHSTEIIPSSDPEEQEFPNPVQTNSLVPCPVCLRKVSYVSINAHLDSGCKRLIVDNDDDVVTASIKPDSKAAWGSLFSKGKKATISSNQTPEDMEIPTTRIAKVSYGLIKNLTALRKLLDEKGLPTTGDKDELIARHERWIAIWNANLDRDQPSAVGELKRELMEREEAINRPGPRKVADEKAWARKHSAQFASLREAARPKPNSLKEPTATTVAAPPSPSSEKDTTSSSDIILID